MKYKVVRIPIEAYLKEKQRVVQIEDRLKKIKKKNVKVKMTDYFRYRANRPVFIYDEDLVNQFNTKKYKRGFSL